MSRIIKKSLPPALASDAIDAPPGNAKQDRHFVTALARGLDLLACFRSGDKALGNQELAERCQLPKSTVSRLTYTLTKTGHLDYVESLGKYRLGSATLALGSAMLARLDVRQLARPLMQELADFSQGMVSLGMRDRLSMIYVENCRSQTALTLSLDVGSRIPLASTAMGRAILAEMRTDERSQLLNQIQQADQANWDSVAKEIRQSISEYQKLGCCTSFGSWQKDVNAIAVAFYPGNGMPPVSINCGGPAFTLSSAFLLEQVRPRLLDLAQRLRISLGA
ncbi:IclR family transcriptional regulator [Undibacterium sp. Jales W-56]|uniref:IclR family transcriptional regulator n=1 Tax=Undibacterium sp. Jales W-56 TaxID=2897325 RepID=UPI0021D0D9B5|nr:IclR family transcriptional regulator [Undibacterium sp. Jales W-56]MCU6432325.1 IclR family transcriptional regulator [Undibacterium sp. Jales W-56]